MITELGRRIRHAFGTLFYGLGFAYVLQRESFLFLRRGRISLPVLVSQVYFTGVEALPILGFLSLGIGAAVIIQGTSLLPQFGQSELAFRILILVITRELGPLLSALVIAARSGSAITTELGNMVVDHEIEAYQAAGIDPVAFLAAPRLLGVTVAMVLLNIYFSLIGLFGSCAVASLLHGVPLAEYLRNLVGALNGADIASSVVKSLVFGNILATVATYYGFKVERAVTEVPQKTIASLGVAMTLCIAANVAITLIFQQR